MRRLPNTYAVYCAVFPMTGTPAPSEYCVKVGRPASLKGIDGHIFKTGPVTRIEYLHDLTLIHCGEKTYLLTVNEYLQFSA